MQDSNSRQAHCSTKHVRVVANRQTPHVDISLVNCGSRSLIYISKGRPFTYSDARAPRTGVCLCHKNT